MSVEVRPEEVAAARARGWKMGDLARAIGVPRRELQAAALKAQPISAKSGIPTTPPAKVAPWPGPERGSTPAPLPAPAGARHTVVSEAEFALLKRSVEEQAKRGEKSDATLAEINARLAKAVQKPIQVDRHEDSVHVSCPNCGESKDVALPPRGVRAGDPFEKVLELLEAPHDDGNKTALNCPNCRPKIDAYLAKAGLELREK